MIAALVVIAVVALGLGAVVVIQGRQLRDLVDNQAHMQADLVATLVNATVTSTPAEYIKAEQVRTAQPTATPRQQLAQVSREQWENEISNIVRGMGYTPPDMPAGLS
jgi:low affinity Fe/Cu permease